MAGNETGDQFPFGFLRQVVAVLGSFFLGLLIGLVPQWFSHWLEGRRDMNRRVLGPFFYSFLVDFLAERWAEPLRKPYPWPRTDRYELSRAPWGVQKLLKAVNEAYADFVQAHWKFQDYDNPPYLVLSLPTGRWSR